MAHTFYAYSTPWTTYSQERSSMTESHAIERRVRRRTLSHSVKVGTATLSITLMVMIAVLMIALLKHANSVATKGYAIRKLAEEHEMLATENRLLQQQVADLRSLARIKESDVFGSLVPVNEKDVRYVHYRDSFALK